MRFAFFGYDYSIDIAKALMVEGHELLALFTFPCDQSFAYNIQTYELADTMAVPITDKRVTEGHIASLLQEGCELFLVAGYPRKIPPIDGKAYGVNIHPALLPRARGITPAPYILMYEPEAAGFSIHKLAPEYDTGDILYQESIPVDADTDVEILSARVALRTRAVVPNIINNLPAYWAKAKPQDGWAATSYPAVSIEMRSLVWTDDAAALQRKSRAFGRYGVLAEIENNEGKRQRLAVYQFTAWVEAHNEAPGRLMRSSPREIVVSVADGFVCLKDFQVVS